MYSRYALLELYAVINLYAIIIVYSNDPGCCGVGTHIRIFLFFPRCMPCACHRPNE